MDEAAQRIIDARRVEQRQRPLGAEVELAVGDLVADRRQRGDGKEAREFGGVGAAARQFVAAFEHVRVGDLLRADADLDRGAVFADQRLELLEQIGAKLLRLRHRRRVDAGLAEFREGARVRRRRAVGRVGQAQFGIAEQRARRGRRRHAVLEEALDRAAQRLRRLIVEARETVDRLAGRCHPLERAPDVVDRRDKHRSGLLDNQQPRPGPAADALAHSFRSWPRCRRSRRYRPARRAWPRRSRARARGRQGPTRPTPRSFRRKSRCRRDIWSPKEFCVLSDPAWASRPSILARISLVCSPTLCPSPVGDLAGEIDRLAVNDRLRHARAGLQSGDGHGRCSRN